MANSGSSPRTPPKKRRIGELFDQLAQMHLRWSARQKGCSLSDIMKVLIFLAHRSLCLRRLLTTAEGAETMATARRFLAVFVCALMVSSCQSEAEKQAMAVAAQAAAERALFEQRRTEVLASPGAFINWESPEMFDKGIINSYRQLIAVTIANNSAVTVTVEKARAVWLTEQGEEVGTSPVTFVDGTLAPGMKKRFSTSDSTLTSGTIQGDAKKIRIEFVTVQVSAPLQR